MKKQFSLFLFLCGTIVAQAAAFSGSGSGASGDPYIITTEEQLSEVQDNLSGYYQLGANIELTGEWVPIKNFTGTLDGNGKVVSGLRINLPDTDGVGLFGSVSGNATITDLGVIIDPTGSVKGRACVGAIAGDISSNAVEVTIRNSFVSGAVFSIRDNSNENTVNQLADRGQNTGGVVGRINGGTNEITNCYATGSVKGNDRTGGIVGQVQAGTSTISKCYAVNAIDGGYQSAGGIVGSVENGNNSTISDCAAINPSIRGGGASSRICGYKGDNLILTNNIAYAEMLLNGNSVTGETIDPITGDPIDKKHGLSKTAAELKSRQTYETGLSWDFNNVWSMGNAGYPLPILKKIETASQPTACPEHIIGGADTAIEQTSGSSITVYSRDGILYASSGSSELIRQIYVYNAQGELIHADNKIRASSYEVKETAWPAIYVVKLVTDRVKTVKVFNK
jgi:hypothetical protein